MNLEAEARAAWLIAAGLALSGCAVLPSPGGNAGKSVEAKAVDEAQARQLIAAYRRSRGLGDVVLDPALQRVAQRQADAMARADELSHTVAGALPVRLAAEGADRSAAIENVSAGYGTLDAAITGWKSSPAHDANLRFPPVRRMGIAAAVAPGTRFKTFWALEMTD